MNIADVEIHEEIIDATALTFGFGNAIILWTELMLAHKTGGMTMASEMVIGLYEEACDRIAELEHKRKLLRPSGVVDERFVADIQAWMTREDFLYHLICKGDRDD